MRNVKLQFVSFSAPHRIAPASGKAVGSIKAKRSWANIGAIKLDRVINMDSNLRDVEFGRVSLIVEIICDVIS